MNKTPEQQKKALLYEIYCEGTENIFSAQFFLHFTTVKIFCYYKNQSANLKNSKKRKNQELTEQMPKSEWQSSWEDRHDPSAETDQSLGHGHVDTKQSVTHLIVQGVQDSVSLSAFCLIREKPFNSKPLDYKTVNHTDKKTEEPIKSFFLFSK